MITNDLIRYGFGDLHRGRTYRNGDTVCSSPSLMEYFGAYPIISFAFEIFATDFLISPSREGSYMTGTSIPTIVFTVSASSFSEVCPPQPTLNTP